VIEGHDTVRFVKAQRITWLGYVQKMSKKRMPKRMLKRNLFSTKRQGRQHTRWLDNVLIDLVVKEVRGCRGRVQDRIGRGRVAKEDKDQ
jgi:hypothetical protein